jgi:hypothetical protein
MNQVIYSLSQKDIWALLKRLIVTNVAFTVIIFLFNIFIDFEDIHKELPLIKELEYQTALIIIIFLLEFLFFVFIIGQWFYSKNSKVSSLEKILESGENDDAEFKSSLRWDYKENKVNKELEHVVARTIAGFMNTKGGTLLIGVNDEKELLGLEMDYNTLKKKNADGFLVHLAHLLNNYFGKEYASFWSAKIISDKSRDICKIDISLANKPAYIKYDNREEFWVRVSATTQPMQIKEAHEYIKMHWKN